MKIALPLIILASLAGLASADTLVQTLTFDFTPNGSRTMTFDKFDSMGGLLTLTGVDVSVTFEKTGGSFEVDNDSETSGTLTLTHSVVGDLTSPDVSLIDQSFQPIGEGLTASNTFEAQVGATSGDPVNTFDYTNTSDYASFYPPSAVADESGTIFAGAQTGYIATPGSSNFGVTFSAIQSVDASGFGGLQESFTVSQVKGSVTVAYHFVPEPTTAMLCGAGAVGMMSRRRRR